MSDTLPTKINIKADNFSNIPFRDVREALKLIDASLLEFVQDSSSWMRLLYELAMTATGTFMFKKVDGAIQRDCHKTHRSVWMRLFELPSVIENGMKRYHCGFLIQQDVQAWLKGNNTNISIEVYGFNMNQQSIPMASGPYVVVSGGHPTPVNEVAERVVSKITEHQQSCQRRCQFFN